MRCSGYVTSVLRRWPRSWWAPALVVSVVVALSATGAAAGAAASHLRLLASGVRGFVSDGTRYVAWEKRKGSPITIFDSQAGTYRQITPPRECTLRRYLYSEGVELRGPAAAGRFLLDCQQAGFALLEAPTMHITSLPTTLGRGVWHTVGSLYIEGSSSVGSACSHSEAELREPEPWCTALYEISTGVVSYRPFGSPQAELDRAGAPLACSRLRQKAGYESLGTEGEERNDYANGLYVHAARNRDVMIERCNGKSITLKDRGSPRDFDVRGGMLTWDTGHPGSELQDYEPDKGPGSLFSYDLATRTRRSWPLPKLAVDTEAGEGTPPIHGVFGYSTHTSKMVFWLATRKVECVVGPTKEYVPLCGHPEVFSLYAASL